MINILLDLLLTNYSKLGFKNTQLFSKVYENAKLSIPANISYNMVVNRNNKLNEYRKQLVKLFEVKQFVQRTPEWYAERYSLITASDLGQILGVGKFGSQRDIIIKKTAPFNNDPNANNINIDVPAINWGVMYEQVANNIYSQRNNVECYDFGLIKHPLYEFFGASPDSISENGIMIEIKCPFRRKIDGSCPEQYYLQIQGQLSVVDLYECDYLECDFKEYKNEFEFLADSDESNKFTREMMEKGIIFEYINNGHKNYIYSPIRYDLTQLIKWKKDTEELMFDKVYTIKYWYLKEYSCKRIYRDDNFFHENIDKAKIVWDKILEYRQNPELYNTEVLSKKRAKTIIETNKAKLKFQDQFILLDTFAFKKNVI